MLKLLLIACIIVPTFGRICLGDDAATIDVTAAQAKLDAKAAARKATTQPAATTRPVVAIPSIEGVWEEAPGVLVTISQSDGKWTAKCEYTNADKDDIKWEITSGSITADGKLRGKLHHTKAPAGWAMWQDREARLSKDGKTIAGTASWNGGGDKFTWTKTNPTEGAKDAADANAPVTDKKVVLSAKDFKALPVFKKRISKSIGPINYSALGTWAGDGTPMGFTATEKDAVGYVTAARVMSIIDDSTAIVEVSLIDSRTGCTYDMNGGANVTRDLIVEGVSTKGQADDNAWRLRAWFKIVDTRKVGDTTYFVAWPIVQAGVQKAGQK